MPRPVCVECHQEMRVLKNGVPVVILDSDGYPYKIYAADMFICDDCTTRVLSGFSQKPNTVGQFECTAEMVRMKALGEFFVRASSS